MKKDKIENIALELFIKYGFRSVTMDSIAQEAHVSKKTLYEMFGNKSALVGVCTQKHLSEIGNLINEYFENSSNAVEEVTEIMNFLSSTHHIKNNNVSELRSHYPESFERFKDFQNQVIRQSIVRNIERGKSEGLYREEINVEILANYRVASIFYVLDELKTNLSLEEFILSVREITNNFLRGLMTAKGIKLYEKLITEA